MRKAVYLSVNSSKKEDLHSLTLRGIHDENDVISTYSSIYFSHLIEKSAFLFMTSTCINNNNLVFLFYEMFDSLLSNSYRVSDCVATVKWNT